jgi:hypothetical protein|tara:strand:+ start:7219 stop:7407 length:189 start_codon:yes stop_codon:yes gene_type:complete
VEEVIEHEDGTATIVFDASDEFYDWWIEDQELEEFDQEKFEAWFIDSLKKGMDLMGGTDGSV